MSKEYGNEVPKIHNDNTDFLLVRSLQFDEINRIRRDVDAKIEEISSQLKVS